MEIQGAIIPSRGYRRRTLIHWLVTECGLSTPTLRAHSVTCPDMGLLTGRYPFRTDVGRWPQHAVIESDRTTIASLLKAQGYHTTMVGKWHLGFEEVSYDTPWAGGPVDVGFDSFFGIRASTDIPPYFYIRDDHVLTPPTVPIAAHHSEGWSPIQGEFWRAGKIAPDLKLVDVPAETY